MKRRSAIKVISFLMVALIALSALTWVNYSRAAEYERFVNASYQHSFSELVTSMSQVDTALQKCLYATSPSVAGPMCMEVFGKAMTAQMSLGMMPFSTVELEQTASFISKVGDYAYMLSRSASRGQGYTEEEKANLKALSDTATVLYQNLNELQMEMAGGTLSFEELERAQDELDEAEQGQAPVSMNSSMRLIEGEFPEMPSLIYDGPFSEHLTTAEPKLLEGTGKLTPEEARKTAADFLGIAEGRVVVSAVSEGRLPCYYLTATAASGKLTLELSVMGGRVINLLSEREVGESGLSDEEAVARAKEFLERHDFAGMRESYFMKQDGIMTINFAYEQDGVLCYSDLVKVGVALDDGSIMTLETRGYVMNHAWRDIPQPEISAEQAREQVSPELEIVDEGLVIIPTTGSYELFCHEFKCKTEDGKSYIIYVNAVSGEQEKILILLEDDNGALTL